MKILVINDTSIGGAFISASNYYHTLKGLQQYDVSFTTYFGKKRNFRGNLTFYLFKVFGYLLKRLILRKESRYFTLGSKSLYPFPNIDLKAFDVINVHWLGNKFVNLTPLFNSKKKLLVTLHDSWFITGGCHLPYDCKEFDNDCNHCPECTKRSFQNLIKGFRKTKIAFLKKENVVLIAPSYWLKSIVEKKLNKKCFLIRNPFIPQVIVKSKNSLRDELGFALNSLVLMVSAVGIDKDPNKGGKKLSFLKRILEKENKRQIEFLIVGAKGNLEFPRSRVFGITHCAKQMAKYYSVSDIFLLMSDNENLPYSVIEASYYKAYPICFNVGGVSEIISATGFGALVEKGDYGAILDRVNNFEKVSKPHIKEVQLKINTKFGENEFVKNINKLIK